MVDFRGIFARLLRSIAGYVTKQTGKYTSKRHSKRQEQKIYLIKSKQLLTSFRYTLLPPFSRLCGKTFNPLPATNCGQNSCRLSYFCYLCTVAFRLLRGRKAAHAEPYAKIWERKPLRHNLLRGLMPPARP